MLSQYQEAVTIHGVKHIRVKRAPAYMQLPSFKRSKPEATIPGNNSKIVPPKAAELGLEIKHLDSDIARQHRRNAKMDLGGFSHPDGDRFLVITKARRSKLQAERAFIMEQANPKKVVAPKFRPMRRKRVKKEVAP